MHVQIVSDVVCPWCRIGKKNLRDAATRFTQETGEHVEITHLPYLLDPIQPEEEGEAFVDRFIARKGLSREQVEQMFARVTEVGASVGLHFDFDKIRLAVNTVPAHELMALTPADQREFMMDALMTAYFEHGENVGDIDVLLRIAADVLGEAASQTIAAPLREHREREAVLGSIGEVQRAGIRSVPFTIIGGAFSISGAQPPQAFYETLLQAHHVQTAAAKRES